MKSYKYRITRNLEKLLSIPVRKKDNVISILLEVVGILPFGIVNTNLSDNFFEIRVDKMSRVFFVLEGKNKMFSFNFPFIIEDFGEGLSIKHKETRVEIAGNVLASTSSIVNTMLKTQESYSINDIESELLEIAMEVESLEFKNDIWEIVKTLLMFEPGYIRFDFDPDRACEKLHPLNHFDVYYSTANQFKIGLANKISYSSFLDILNLSTDSAFIES